MCEVAMMSTPASSNIASDEVSEVEDMVTDDGEDNISDDFYGNFVDNIIQIVIKRLRELFEFEEESAPSYNTTMGV
ncbi:unnamed protein product [Schistosoma guineensis]|nr:unnamed protein product [Schistosoma guineensis]CAH8664288.1 unnamed protein product [Schistosoma guineensis]